MSTRVKTQGSNRIEWKRPAWEWTSEGTYAKMEGVGIYDEMKASVAKVGATHVKVIGLKIARITLEPGQANDGKMVIYFGGPANLEGGADPAVYERDFGTESRPIEQHPKAPKLKPDRPYYEAPDRAYHASNNKRYTDPAGAGAVPVAQRTFEHWAALDTQDVSGGDWSLAQFKSLKEAGWSDYEHSFPIARATTFSTDRPGAAAGILTVDNPPSACGAPGSGWMYFKATDRMSNEGSRYRRSQEWEGRRGADATLYALVYG